MSEPAEGAGARRAGKSDSAFRTIGEVAENLDVPAHVLRFWESKFPQLKPLKRGGGRRYYRPEDILLLRHIRQCLYQEGYTIRGANCWKHANCSKPSHADRAATPELEHQRGWPEAFAATRRDGPGRRVKAAASG